MLKQIPFEVIELIMQKKADIATDITAKKHDYVTNASLTSQLNDLKSQHIATEVTAIDNKTKKNASNILALESNLQQKEDTISENERGNSFARGLSFYIDQSYLVYNCKIGSFDFNINKISKWKSTGTFNYFSNSKYFTSPGMIAFGGAKNDCRMHVYLSGNCFKQDKTRISNNNNVINIYIVYKLDPIASSRDTILLYKIPYFKLCKLLKILILQNMTTKDVTYVLIKEVSLVIQ